jgi:hypothetical protein
MTAEAGAWRRNTSGEVKLVVIGQAANSQAIATCNPAVSQAAQTAVKSMHLSKADGNHHRVAQSWHIDRN